MNYKKIIIWIYDNNGSGKNKKKIYGTIHENEKKSTHTAPFRWDNKKIFNGTELNNLFTLFTHASFSPYCVLWKRAFMEPRMGF